MKIENKNCYDFLNGLKENSVNMVFADLPYNISNAEWDKQIIDLDRWWKGVNRVLKDDGVAVCTAATPFNILLGYSNLSNLKYEWIYEKTQATGHLNAETMPMKAHENVLVFYKNQPTYNPQKTTGHTRKVSTAIHKRNTDTGELYNKCDSFKDYDSTERFPRSVLQFKSDKQKLNIHSAQKPLRLLKYFVSTYTNKGDLVIDTTCGSGGLLIACKDLEREVIINDIDPYWCEVSRLRYIEGWDKKYPNKKQLKERLKLLKSSYEL